MKSKPKNRTVIGIICIAVAVALVFLVTPLVNKVSTDTVSVLRVNKDIPAGRVITAADMETVEINKSAVGKGNVTEKKLVAGKRAATMLYAGDFITADKLTGAVTTTDSVFSSLNGQKFAMSFTIDSFAAGLSGKIQNGDIISLVVVNGSGAVMPPEFKYVKVVTTTTAGGIDQDKVKKKDDGTVDPPATVTLLVNSVQAKLLAEYEASVINCILVYRGNPETADQFLVKQDAYF